MCFGCQGINCGKFSVGEELCTSVASDGLVLGEEGVGVPFPWQLSCIDTTDYISSVSSHYGVDGTLCTMLCGGIDGILCRLQTNLKGLCNSVCTITSVAAL